MKVENWIRVRLLAGGGPRRETRATNRRAAARWIGVVCGGTLLFCAGISAPAVAAAGSDRSRTATVGKRKVGFDGSKVIMDTP